jgi:hypothetical protein
VPACLLLPGADMAPRRLWAAMCHEPTSLAAVGEAAVAIECDTEMRSQRGDGRVLLRIGIGLDAATMIAHASGTPMPCAMQEDRRAVSIARDAERQV